MTLSARAPVLVLRGGPAGEVRGALDERDLWRLKPGARAVFVPTDLSLPTVPVRLQSVSQSAMAQIDPVELAASHGGPVADRQDAHRRSVPVTAQYAVIGEATDMPPAEVSRTSLSGVLIAEGAPESMVARLRRQVLKVLVRESGF